MGILTFEVVKRTVAPILSLKDLVFSGSTYLVIPNAPEYQIAAGTITCWFTMSLPPNSIMGLFSKDMSGTEIPGHLSVWWNGQWQARLQDTVKDYLLLSPKGVTADGAKHHLAIGFGPTYKYRLIIDGVQIAHMPTLSLGLKDNNLPFFVGVRSTHLSSPTPPYPGLASNFKGTIHSLNIYPKELSLDEIRLKMQIELLKPPVAVRGEPFSDGTFFTDGSGWVPYSI